jgi:DNA polymerase-3 subunit alpha
MGIEILPPDVNRGDRIFTVEDDAIRFALCGVKNVGLSAAKAVVESRGREGSFGTMFDLCERVDPRSLNKRAIESLLKAGALDSITARRAQAAAVLDKACDMGAKAHKDRESGQFSIFDSLQDKDEGVSVDHDLPDIPEWDGRDKLAREREALGFYLSGHPLSEFAEQLRSIRTTRIENLFKARGTVTIGGIVNRARKRQTKSGRMMATFFLEDDTGNIETLVFPDAYETMHQHIFDDAIVVVEGSTKREGDSLRLFVTGIVPLAEHKMLERKGLRIEIDLSGNRRNLVADIIELINQNPGDSHLGMRLKNGGEFDIEVVSRNLKVSSGGDFIARLQELVGRGNVVITRYRNDFGIS